MSVIERWAIRNPPSKPDETHPLRMVRRLADDQRADWEGEVEVVRADQLQGAVEALRQVDDLLAETNGATADDHSKVLRAWQTARQFIGGQ